jgi:hypothetical protein
MASDPIETAPKNEEWIVLLGESGDVFEVARWSVEKGNWVGREGAPIRITPTHWFRPNPSWLPSAYTSSASPQAQKAPRRKRFGLYAGLLIGWSVLLEASWFVGLPTRENFVKFFPTEASVAPQTVASHHVAGAEMANLYVRSEPNQGLDVHPESPAIIGDPAHAREQAQAVTGRILPATSAGDAAASGHEQALRQVDALARDVVALREEIEALKSRFAASTMAHAEPAQYLELADALPRAESLPAQSWYETAMVSALLSHRNGSTWWPTGQWPNVQGFDGPRMPTFVQRVN